MKRCPKFEAIETILSMKIHKDVPAVVIQQTLDLGDDTCHRICNLIFDPGSYMWKGCCLHDRLVR